MIDYEAFNRPLTNYPDQVDKKIDEKKREGDNHEKKSQHI